MELVEVLQQIIQENSKAMQPADLVVGTVTQVKPLEITTDNQAAPLRASVLYLTAAVVEKKVTTFAHSHNTTHNHTVTDATIQPAGECSTELTGITCYENGKALPNDGFITLLVFVSHSINIPDSKLFSALAIFQYTLYANPPNPMT